MRFGVPDRFRTPQTVEMSAAYSGGGDLGPVEQDRVTAGRREFHAAGGVRLEGGTSVELGIRKQDDTIGERNTHPAVATLAERRADTIVRSRASAPPPPHPTASRIRAAARSHQVRSAIQLHLVSAEAFIHGPQVAARSATKALRRRGPPRPGRLHRHKLTRVHEVGTA